MHGSKYCTTVDEDEPIKEKGSLPFHVPVGLLPPKLLLFLLDSTRFLSCRAWTRRRRLSIGLAISLFAITLFCSEPATNQFNSLILRKERHDGAISTSSGSPFNGAFSRFPRISALPARQKRMTIISVWNGDTTPTYLRHFMYTMQLNADVVDLLLINRLPRRESRCLDFDKAGINITWGGNVKVLCMDDKEWKRRHVDFVCSAKYGWDCSPKEYEEVAAEFHKRPDKKNYTWRPFRGYIFQDMFANPGNPFWAWVDIDCLIGNFDRYPFNILSGLSLLTGYPFEPDVLMMAGQLTAFNLDDRELGTAWKKFPEMKTPDHFTKYLNGVMPESPEEVYWSSGYLSSDEGSPGSNLSWAIVPGLQGDDYYDHRWYKKDASEVFIISGRDILLVSVSYTRRELEEILRMERELPVDDLGGIGWTGGEDGSEYLIEQPGIDTVEAKRLAVDKAKASQQDVRLHEGLVEGQLMLVDCPVERIKYCVKLHPLETSRPPLMTSSLVRFKEQPAGHLLRRLERDNRHRGYERKLLRHHHRLKKLPWFELPPFDITDEHILRYNNDGLEVFKMGESRDVTLFSRKEGDGKESDSR